MPKYTDLLEQRATIKATKETMLQMGYKREDISKLDIEISRLSIAIRSYKHINIDETPTKLLPEPVIVPDDFVQIEKPPVIPLTYDRFYYFHEEKIMKSITSQLIDVQVPLGVYAMFKNSIIQSKDYIMKHHYQLYIKSFENEQWTGSASFYIR